MPPRKTDPSAQNQFLAEVRARIDQIDGVIHDMLKERFECIEDVRKIKGKQDIYIRPGREAQVFRGLLARPQGKVPPGLVYRLWREMINIVILQESGGNFKAGVYAPAKDAGLWDLAREHYGPYTPLVAYPTAKATLKAVQDQKINVAILPWPDHDEKDSWWDLLVKDKKNELTIFQSLVFDRPKIGRANARQSLRDGLIVGNLYPELTGDDRSFLALECVHVPEAEIKRLLGKAGYKVRALISRSTGRAAAAPMAYCVEVEGFINRNDTRIGRIKAMLGSRLKKLVPLGGYPAPLKSVSRRASP